MVARSAARLVKIGQLATPAKELGAEGLEGKAKYFLREVTRCLPWIVRNYKLDELTTVPELRRNVSQLFKQHAHVKTPGVVDMLIYKGREELEMILLQHKQRHHLISQFIESPAQQRQQQATGNSTFLDSFYASN